MRIGLLCAYNVDPSIADRLRDRLLTSFQEVECTLLTETLVIPSGALDETRGQYRSNVILRSVDEQATRQTAPERILGVVDVDIFVPPLSFVFGEAECPGRAALISLFRLRPEFYGQRPDVEAFLERVEKEAVHEIGHTLGLKHCSNPFCVMHFSNSIFDTDRKQSLFCGRCQRKIEALIAP
jgi:archaemetzincin